jgi:hypothetical protein
LSVFVALTLVASAASPEINTSSAAKELVSRIRVCGFREIVARYDDELQMDAVLIRDEAASDSTLECVAKVHDQADSGLLVEFESEQLELRYFEQLKLTYAPRMREVARSWLAERDLLAMVPEYSTSGLSDKTFLKRIEAICGPASIGMLIPLNGKFAFKPSSTESIDDPVVKEATACLIYASIWSRFELGFFGNEAVP